MFWGLFHSCLQAKFPFAGSYADWLKQVTDRSPEETELNAFGCRCAATRVLNLADGERRTVIRASSSASGWIRYAAVAARRDR
jgi:hypothetical protein